jgi:hypothetical protein
MRRRRRSRFLNLIHSHSLNPCCLFIIDVLVGFVFNPTCIEYRSFGSPGNTFFIRSEARNSLRRFCDLVRTHIKAQLKHLINIIEEFRIDPSPVRK